MIMSREGIPMIRMISRRGCFAVLGLIWVGVTGEGQAWERPPVKVITEFRFDIEVKVGPDGSRPTMPWYAYFPADPRIMPSPQASPFPPFPVAFPPQAYPQAALKQMLRANVPQGSMQTQYWPSQYVNPSNVQPVGYAPAQAPSYWYN